MPIVAVIDALPVEPTSVPPVKFTALPAAGEYVNCGAAIELIVSVSVAELLAVFGSVVPPGAVTVAVFASEPLAPDDTAGRHRFLREARAAAAIQHPNVVAVHETIELDDGTPAFVMELLLGESLADRLQREPQLGLAWTAAMALA